MLLHGGMLTHNDDFQLRSLFLMMPVESWASFEYDLTLGYDVVAAMRLVNILHPTDQPALVAFSSVEKLTTLYYFRS